MTNVINGLVFISSLSFIYAVLSSIFIRPKTINRLEKYFDIESGYIQSGEEDKKKIKKFTVRSLLNSLGKKISEIVLLKKYITKIQIQTTKAGLLIKGEEFLAIQFLCFIGVGMFNYYWTKNIIISSILAIASWVLPSTIIRLKIKKRYKLFNDQIVDSIVLISNSLKAGYSFLQAVQSVATEMPDPISYEFKKLLKELRFGLSTENALENLIKRVESDDLELVVNAVMIQREIGGNLSEILDNISETIRERVKLKGEIRTLTAQGRISGIVIAFLPMVLGTVIYLLNPDYMSTLFNNKYGLIILLLSFISQLIGMLFISKIVKIEV